ncbi:MAG: HAD family hydrolase [Mangrovibacterium sp.]
MTFQNIRIIAFDADDTLWATEDYFRLAEQQFSRILQDYGTHEELMELHFATILQNMPIYGFGVKAFVLSSLEAAMKISNYQLTNGQTEAILNIGKEMLKSPVELLGGVKETLQALHRKYKLVVLTKGDLLDQQRKLKASGVAHYFDHMEVMSDKKQSDYEILFRLFHIRPEQFMMVGNSLKSDIIPIVELGGTAVHIPYHTTWAYEQLDKEGINRHHYHSLENIGELLYLLKSSN